MIVMKFGGTSVKNPENIRKVVEITTRAHREEGARAVIVSAFGGATDTLISLADLAAARDASYKETFKALEQRHLDAVADLVSEDLKQEASEQVKALLEDLGDILSGVYLLREASPRSRDFITSFGERLSATIISYAMRVNLADCRFLDARKVVRTDYHFGLATVDWETTRQQIRDHFEANPGLQLVTGFIGSTPQGQTTTLGRGGSDYSASLFGAALDADEIQIWTDVSGVLTADPRKVPEVQPVERMSYEEAMEIAHWGAKVIYPPTMAPAMRAGIPLRIKNTFAPDDPGTLIGKEPAPNAGRPRAISSIDSVAMLQLKGSGLIGVAGVANRLFGALANAGVSVILISQASSEHAICFAVKPHQAEQARKAVDEGFAYEILRKTVDPVTVEMDRCIIAVVGAGMAEVPGISGRLFATLGSVGVNIDAIAQGSSELNISLVVRKEDERKSIRVIHEAFFEDAVTRVFMVGHGLIGKSLLAQLRKLQWERPEMPPIKLCGVANSRKMAFDPLGLDLTSIDSLLEAGQTSDLEAFVEKALHRPGSVLVDNTAGGAVPAHYARLLGGGVSVVTPNKVAATASYASWTELQKLASGKGVGFLYEANVGAGLPVLSSLRLLLGSGDRVTRIEAVLSGTLSYLFNTYTQGMSFCELLRSAKEKGFTEPDPREDLGGTDVARKLLILARECGLEMELTDIDVENLIPESCQAADSVEDFFAALEKEDGSFARKLEAASRADKVLRYVATLEGGKGHVALRAVDASHPCYGLSGADNLISYTTERYPERPMVIKGPGAGAEVTSAQVLAEILQIANRRQGQ